jgi:subtilisin family serine protease
MAMLRRSYRRYLCVVAVIALLGAPLPLFVTATAGETSATSPVFSSNLLAVLSTSSPNERIPVVAEFPQGTSPDAMVAAVMKLGIDLEVRHAFHIIPMISLYVRAASVKNLGSIAGLVGVAYDRTMSIADTSNTGQVVLADNGNGYVHFTEQIGVEDLWAEGYNGTGMIIAILDTGVYGEHPDLAGKLVGFKDLIRGLDDMNPGDGVIAYDDNGHGTACAWLAAGDGFYNGGNFTGVAPGASVLAVKVLQSDGSGEDSVIADGIEFAMDNGADVISLSLGGAWSDQQGVAEPSVAACKVAVTNGVTVVAAAGNSGPAASTITSPGITEEVITVGASAGMSGVVAFSSTGPVYRVYDQPLGYMAKPDVVAPGSNVVSGRGDIVSAIEYPAYNQSEWGTTYTQWSGTSASTPIVGGLVLILQQKQSGGLTPLKAKTALMESAVDLGLDPMAQGYGLVNGTAASDLIISSSEDITLMAPMRIPTLPWSSEVLIVGDERPPQNITVMSTYSLGIVDVEITGNASQFVTSSVSTLGVTTGYNYFGVSLLIPEDPPISVVGDYHGTIDLVQGSTTYASIDVQFTVTLFGGRLMTDMEHHSSTDIDDPSYYGYFTEYLRRRGVVLSEFGNPSDLTTTRIDLTTISGADVFMIMDTETYYTDGEVDALHSFVENGGTLLMLSEYYDSTTHTASYAMDSYNRILKPFGIQCEARGIGEGLNGLGLIYGATSPLGGAVEADPLMANVTNLYIVQGSTLSVNTSIANARGLFWADTARTHAIVATAEYGRGKVYVISDGSTLYDDILYEAISFGADNLQLIRNLATQLEFSAPRIFDVRLDTERLGELANVTAYVFDDDLESVTLKVIPANGPNITGAVAETYGYKFTTNFTLNSAGFYTIEVTAIDLAGNHRVFQKTILIPVDAADDPIVQIILFSLLGVVGVSLAYVGYLKFFAGKRKRRAPPTQEDEWELPPPAIE